MKRYALGDPHGGYLALLQVLERSKFNYQEDQLICLGDVADGWPQVSDCFDELLKIKNLVYVLGNHDAWLSEWFKTGARPTIWVSQGGLNSIKSYIERLKEDKLSETHQKLLENAKPYYVTEDNKLFVHGGFDWHKPIKDQKTYDLIWDRNLFSTACMWQQWVDRGKPLNIVKDYDEVFIGHTSTCYTHKDMLPVHVSNVWNLDQGAGWEGKLTLQNIDTKEFVQSDIVKYLYPNEKGR